MRQRHWEEKVGLRLTFAIYSSTFSITLCPCVTVQTVKVAPRQVLSRHLYWKERDKTLVCALSVYRTSSTDPSAVTKSCWSEMKWRKQVEAPAILYWIEATEQGVPEKARPSLIR